MVKKLVSVVGLLLALATPAAAQLKVEQSFSTLVNPTILGQAQFAAGTAAAPSISFSADSDTGVYSLGGGGLAFSSNGNYLASMNGASTTYGFTMGSGYHVGWAASNTEGVAADTRLVRTSANFVSVLNNGSTLGTIGAAILQATGSSLSIRSTTSFIDFYTNNTGRLTIDSSGNLYPTGDGTQNLGATDHQWLNGYFAGPVRLANGNTNALYAKNKGGTAKHVIGINSSDQVLISGDGAAASFGGGALFPTGINVELSGTSNLVLNTGNIYFNAVSRLQSTVANQFKLFDYATATVGAMLDTSVNSTLAVKTLAAADAATLTANQINATSALNAVDRIGIGGQAFIRQNGNGVFSFRKNDDATGAELSFATAGTVQALAMGGADTAIFKASQFAISTTMVLNGAHLTFSTTPSAWSSGQSVELGPGGGLWGSGASNYFTSNYYYNSGDKFAGTGYAMHAAAIGSTGTFKWTTSNASGTAGNAATMVELMSLGPTGTLTIPSLASVSGTRYLCINTSGVISSSATACSGT